ncbi:hypothetical protein PF010_g24467 [Phytophthora fragariae]|uniref:Uncharacterized protein n=1 Tax=Phytophthora fragariae TaxID=53985 RepID=A0A6G0N002_9STRA|nr:hypothetical protein PF010_g24467 [Phytophthora fragariae]KAE9186882.1 hypothetical protein PF004_g22958 [Phytophthora fragariae]
MVTLLTPQTRTATPAKQNGRSIQVPPLSDNEPEQEVNPTSSRVVNNAAQQDASASALTSMGTEQADPQITAHEAEYIVDFSVPLDSETDEDGMSSRGLNGNTAAELHGSSAERHDNDGRDNAATNNESSGIAVYAETPLQIESIRRAAIPTDEVLQQGPLLQPQETRAVHDLLIFQRGIHAHGDVSIGATSTSQNTGIMRRSARRRRPTTRALESRQQNRKRSRQ